MLVTRDSGFRRRCWKLLYKRYTVIQRIPVRLKTRLMKLKSRLSNKSTFNECHSSTQIIFHVLVTLVNFHF